MCESCVDHPRYHLSECDLLASNNSINNINISDYSENNIFYACIMPLRMWRTQQLDDKAWNKINFLQEDNSEAFCNQGIWREVADFVHDKLGITNIDKKELTRLSSIKVGFCQKLVLSFLSFFLKDVNACSLTQSNDVAGTALFGVYPLMNSYCYCNTMYIINPDTKIMELRAQRSIKKGEEITTRYVLPSMEQPARQV